MRYSLLYMLNMSKLVFVDYTELAMSTVTQRQSIYFSGTVAQLHLHLSQLTRDVEVLTASDGKTRGLKVFKQITIIHSPNMITLEVCERHVNASFYSSPPLCFYARAALVSFLQWTANPINDMYADAVLAVILRADSDKMQGKGEASNFLSSGKFQWHTQ